MALPVMDAMVLPAVAQTGQQLKARVTEDGFPIRMGFIYHPNGVIVPNWQPKGSGANYQMSPTLKTIERHRSVFQVVGGLDHHKAKSNGDGGGDHARANATFLTGRQARKTAGADIQIGISVDQVAARLIGRETKLPSLELSGDRSRMAGKCDSGYSCAYQYNLSWKNQSVPMPGDANPRLIFERLFGSGKQRKPTESERLRKLYQNSILDLVLDDAKRLKSKLGNTDQRKLDEYMESVREIEIRMQQAEKFNDVKMLEYKKPSGIPRDFREHVRLMYDLMTLAYQTDTTRIASFLVAHDGSNRTYPQVGVNSGHHAISHHRGENDKISQLKKIDHFLVSEFGYFLDRMRSVKEGNGTLLDHSMILYGGGIKDGDRHSHVDLPVLLAGKAGGFMHPGRAVHHRAVPMCNLYVSMLKIMGLPINRFGDSNGYLKNV